MRENLFHARGAAAFEQNNIAFTQPFAQTGGAGGVNSGTQDGEAEVCAGPSDNPDVCPIEADGCAGPGCGGSNTPDDTIDYGDCGCSGSSAGGSGIILR